MTIAFLVEARAEFLERKASVDLGASAA